MRFKQYITEGLKPDEVKFYNLLMKMIKKEAGREMKKFGEKSAMNILKHGINAGDVFDKMEIYKNNVKWRILNNLEKANKIVTDRKTVSGSRTKRYQWGRKSKTVPIQDVSISVRPNYKNL